MPVASERVPNTALSTSELRSLLLRDFERLISQFSLLSSSAAFPRVAWDIRLALHLDNALSPIADTFLQSRAEGSNSIRQQPGLAAVSTIPIVGAERPAFEARLLHRDIASPNEERLRHGLPVPVEVRQSDGSTVTQQLQYPADETLGEGAVSVEARNLLTAMELKVPVTDIGITSMGIPGPRDHVHITGLESELPVDLDLAPPESPEARIARIKAEADLLDQAEQDRLSRLAAAQEAIPPVVMERLPDAIPVTDAAAKLAAVEREVAAEIGVPVPPTGGKARG